MDTINLFGKEIEYKNYDCSCDRNSFCSRKPIFNLYLQISDLCNANCKFCDKPSCSLQEQEFDAVKFKDILKTLYEKNILAGISITGGEPLLNPEKLDKALDVIYGLNPNAYVYINTNGSKMDNFYKLKHFDKISEIHISRHAYSDEENQNVFMTKVATLKEIHDFANKNKHITIKLNCVLQKGLVDSSDKVGEYLDNISEDGAIKEVRFITLLPLTYVYEELKVNTDNLVNGLNSVNAGYMYDKDICECYSFIHVDNKGYPITAFVRNTKKANSPYLRQLLYDSQNNLLTGFGGEIII